MFIIIVQNLLQIIALNANTFQFNNFIPDKYERNTMQSIALYFVKFIIVKILNSFLRLK